MLPVRRGTSRAPRTAETSARRTITATPFAPSQEPSGTVLRYVSHGHIDPHPPAPGSGSPRYRRSMSCRSRRYCRSLGPGPAHWCRNAVAEGATNGRSQPWDSIWRTLREMILSQLATPPDEHVVRCMNLLEDG